MKILSFRDIYNVLLHTPQPSNRQNPELFIFLLNLSCDGKIDVHP